MEKEKVNISAKSLGNACIHTYSKHTDLLRTAALTFPARLHRGLFFLLSIATKMTFGS